MYIEFHHCIFQTDEYTTVTLIESVWNNQNPAFARPGRSNASYYYDTFDIIVTEAGWYAIGSTSSIDTYGCFYNGSFVPEYPEWNLAAKNDDGREGNQFRLEAYLEPNHTYTLVATTYGEWIMGSYTIIVFGMVSVTIHRTTMMETTTKPYNSTEWSEFL